MKLRVLKDRWRRWDFLSFSYGAPDGDSKMVEEDSHSKSSAEERKRKRDGGFYSSAES